MAQVDDDISTEKKHNVCCGLTKLDDMLYMFEATFTFLNLAEGLYIKKLMYTLK